MKDQADLQGKAKAISDKKESVAETQSQPTKFCPQGQITRVNSLGDNGHLQS
jgi:hypothetical protein